jgi:hypothetical protein
MRRDVHSCRGWRSWSHRVKKNKNFNGDIHNSLPNVRQSNVVATRAAVPPWHELAMSSWRELATSRIVMPRFTTLWAVAFAASWVITLQHHVAHFVPPTIVAM